MGITGPQRVLIVVGLTGLLAGLIALSVSRSGNPQAPGVTYTAPTPASAPSAPLLAVHVVGAVYRPGLYYLPNGARVAEAIQAAGGWTNQADAASVNLAARVQDGQQIEVGSFESTVPLPSPPNLRPSSVAAASAPPPGPTPPRAGTPVAAAPPTFPLSLSQATLEQLQTLPGIGPELAQRILYYRYEHGGFRTVEELRQVEGIGETRLQQLRPLVTP